MALQKSYRRHSERTPAEIAADKALLEQGRAAVSDARRSEAPEPPPQASTAASAKIFTGKDGNWEYAVSPGMIRARKIDGGEWINLPGEHVALNDNSRKGVAAKAIIRELMDTQEGRMHIAGMFDYDELRNVQRWSPPTSTRKSTVMARPTPEPPASVETAAPTAPTSPVGGVPGPILGADAYESPVEGIHRRRRLREKQESGTSLTKGLDMPLTELGTSPTEDFGTTEPDDFSSVGGPLQVSDEDIERIREIAKRVGAEDTTPMSGVASNRRSASVAKPLWDFVTTVNELRKGKHHSDNIAKGG